MVAAGIDGSSLRLPIQQAAGPVRHASLVVGDGKNPNHVEPGYEDDRVGVTPQEISTRAAEKFRPDLRAAENLVHSMVELDPEPDRRGRASILIPSPRLVGLEKRFRVKDQAPRRH